MKKTLFILLTGTLFLVNNVTNAQWSSATMIAGRSKLSAASAGNQAGFFGGIGMMSNPFNTTDIYNSSTMGWTNSTISTARTSSVAASIGSKIFVAGGANDWILSVYAKVDIYNTSISNWSVANLSVPRAFVAAASAGNQIIFAGGAAEMQGAEYATVDIYDTLTAAWSTSALSVARYGIAAAGAGSKIVFAGGKNIAASVFNTVDIYDVTSGTWSTATLSQARSNAAAVAAGTKIYVAGGYTAAGTSSKVVDIYDVTTNTWTIDSLSVARGNICAATVGTLAFFAAGSDLSGNTVFGDVDVFNSTNGVKQTLTLTTPRALCAATSLGNKFMIGGGVSASGLPLNSIEIYTVLGVAVEENNAVNKFSFYPNPVSQQSKLTLFNTMGEGSLELVNSLGATVFSQDLSTFGNTITIDCADFARGMYFVKVSNDKGSSMQKLLIQ
jgi:hypothetical protein